MFCSNCGIELKEESKFCHSCGSASIVATKTPDSPSSEIRFPKRETQEGRQEFIKEQAEILKCKHGIAKTTLSSVLKIISVAITNCGNSNTEAGALSELEDEIKRS